MRFLNRETLRASLCAVVLCACGNDDADKTTADSAAEVADGGENDAGTGSCKGTGDKDVGTMAEAEKSHPGDTDATQLPIVFVHGFVGSASQFDSQAQRLVANGYSPNKLFAHDHDGVMTPNLDDLDALVEKARTKFKADKIYLIGHSRGTSVSRDYLANPARAAKVEKVVLLDGRPCMDIPVPCDAPNQTNLTGHKHVEVATSPEAFKRFYKFLFGKDASVVDITREADRVEIAGRAVNFPANTGRDGAELKFYEIDSATGERLCDKEIASLALDASGDFGPVRLNPDRHYELTLTGKDSDAVQHFYPQPFLRSTKFVRLLSGPPDSPSRTNSNVGPDHAALTVLRMREWTRDDILKIDEKSESGDATIENVLTPTIAAAGGGIAVYIQDDAKTPKMTTDTLLPYFGTQPFQTGADVYLPASNVPNGVITVTSYPRGEKSKPQVLNFPNWSSDKHTIMVYFSDYVAP
jgi:pimeloyl-ACP methyl ester carboxylesterase